MTAGNGTWSAKTAVLIVVGMLGLLLTAGITQMYRTDDQLGVVKDRIASNVVALTDHEMRLRKLEEEVTARQKQILDAIDNLKMEMRRDESTRRK